MSTEELKMILETIGQIADGGTTAAIVWMVMHYVTPLLDTAIIAVGGFWTAVKIARVVASTNKWESAGRRVGGVLGAPNARYGDMEAGDFDAIDRAVAIIREHKK